MRLSEAVFQGQISRLRFSLLEAIFSCLFLLNGFCKRRFGSFCGCGFAGLGLESCCCLRLSEAVFQGQISRLRFSLLEAIFSWFCVTWARILLLFEAFGSGLPRSDFETKVFFAGGIRFLSLSFFLGSVSDVSALLAVAVLRDLGSNPADLGSNPAAV